MEKEKVRCPECWDGVVWKSCERCPGEEPAGKCALCDGAGEITYALMRLWWANKCVQRMSPEWGGDNAEHEGVTVYSLAEWFRRRPMSISRAWGGLNNGEQTVWLIDARGFDSIRFTGFSWGYAGEGPHGLAMVLADVFEEDFGDYDMAMAFVNRLPQGRRWTLTRGCGPRPDLERRPA